MQNNNLKTIAAVYDILTHGAITQQPHLGATGEANSGVVESRTFSAALPFPPTAARPSPPNKNQYSTSDAGGGIDDNNNRKRSYAGISSSSSAPPQTTTNSADSFRHFAPEVMQLVISAIFEVGLEESSPKKVYLKMRSDPEFVRELLGDHDYVERLLSGANVAKAISFQHVKSHLQRYRAHVHTGRAKFVDRTRARMMERSSAANERSFGGDASTTNNTPAPPDIISSPFTAHTFVSPSIPRNTQNALASTPRGTRIDPLVMAAHENAMNRQMEMRRLLESKAPALAGDVHAASSSRPPSEEDSVPSSFFNNGGT